jgi:DNA-binding LytR/AlgR family response regulator
MTLVPTAVLADDEAALLDHLARRLAELWPELQIVAQANNGVAAAAAIAEHAPTVAFLDIKMPGLSGLEVAQGIETDTRVVFVTAYDQYALQAFESEAVDYLVKPIDGPRLTRTIERLRRALVQAAPPPELASLLSALTRARPLADHESIKTLRWIRASRGNSIFHVPVNDVLYFRSDEGYTAVHTADGEHLIRTPLAELIDGLDGEVFWQIHRSTIVNMAHVKTTRRDETGRLQVQIGPGRIELVVARAYASRFRQM